MWNALKQKRRLAKEGFTNEEIRAILRRAAELQSQAESLSERIDFEALEVSAIAAGIHPEFLEKAIRELKAQRQFQAAQQRERQSAWKPTELLAVGIFAALSIVGIPVFLWLLLTALPVRIVGLVLILLAVALIISEIFITDEGFLGSAGIAALFFGGFMLILGSVGISMAIIGGVIIGGLLSAGLFAILRAQKCKPSVGREWLIGQIGESRTDLTPTGTVFVGGTWWTAEAIDGEIKAGEPVEVVAVNGLRLKVMRHNP